MNFLFALLKGLSTMISLYTIMCFARIVLTWIPSFQNTAAARVLSSLCDPYLYLFKGLKFLRFSSLDFSPILSIGILVMSSSLLSNIAVMQKISLGIFLAMIISLVWSLVSSILNFLIILMVIRLVFVLLNKDTGSIWYSFDQILNPITSRITKIFYAQKYYTPQTALIISVIFIVVSKIVASIGINFIVGFLKICLFSLVKLQDIETPVTSVSGIGPRFAKSLASLNIFTVYQLLTHYPRMYEDRTRLVHLKDFNNGEKVHTVAKVTAHEWFGYGRMKTLKIRIDDDTASAILVCFNRPFLEKTYPVGSLISVTGNFSEKYGDLQSASFEAELLQKDGEKESISMPDNFYSIAVYYPLTAGLSQAQMQKFISTALHEYGKGINNEIPELYRLKYGLLSKQEAIHLIHKPSTLEEANKARQTLIYEELFLFQSGIVKRTLERKGSLPDAMRYAALTENSGASPEIDADNTVLQESFQRSLSPKQRQLADRLSFDLTPDQKSVILQMNRELDESFSGLSKFSMSRLLQGDVGSGKTLVAFFACLRVIDSGFQCAILSPTELLSRQHAENAALLLEPISGIRLAYLTGNIQAKGRNKLLTELSQGSIDIVIGTHALFSKNVQYKHLRFAVIDEQHRFGVIQRNMIIEKGRSPEGKPPSFLMMSATPIPQTLALTVFGDLDVSVIKSMPPGRKSIQTHLTREGNEARVYEAVRKEILSGHQAYFVYPLIEKADEETDQHDNLFDKKTDLKSAEDMFSFLQKEVYPEFSCALVHSKVDEEDQHRILSEFSKGKIQILVATTVVEVGVDVPNATCMVIEHAERFGLAALHQLRGRVGRGKAQSHCFLIYSNKLTDTGKERLKAMHETTDGFQIAELDLKLRGPGEVSGIQQSGSLLLGIADPLRDKDILLKARKDVYEHLTQQSKSLAH